MTHPLAGSFSVEQSAALFRRYRYTVERAMRALAGWIALTPELSAKLLMGRHVWDLAQHCDAFGQRLLELRSPAHGEPASPGVVTFLDALESPEAPGQTVERVAGVYGVLKPHLLALYTRHLAEANPVYEPPTRRLLARAIADERRHVAAGQVVLAHLTATPEARARARDWQRHLEGLLAAADGVTGQGLPTAVLDASPPGELSDDAREWIRFEQAAPAWPLPPGLDQALARFGEALRAGDEAAVGAWLAPGAAAAEALGALAALGPLRAQRVVAVARLGAERVVKLVLSGEAASAVVQARWVGGPDGWRATDLAVVRADPARASAR